MKNYLFICTLFFFITCFSQEENDTLKILNEVIIKAFEQDRKSSTSTFLVKQIEFNNGDRNNKTSLVSGFNSVAGVRMEERSPGSYRINIRGSSLRSPFGVRNVKVYWNNIPLTDPGGNTYFNQLAWNNFSSIEVFKGPAGSMYGAGTGGLLLVNNFDVWKPGISMEYITGSYDLQNVFFTSSFGEKARPDEPSGRENKNQLTYAHNQSDGYRIHSKMRRDNFSWQTQLKISDKQTLSANLLYTDMYYQTPGALTLSEFAAQPKNARPAAGAFPSAVNAKAAIYQKNLTAGFTNFFQITNSFKNSSTLYGAFSQIKNPAIRNYERRNEPGFGGRTVFTYKMKNDGRNEFQLVGGSEFQQGYFNTQVSKNKNGNPDSLQTNDDINLTLYNIFFQSDLNINKKWSFTTGLSFNKTNVSFTRFSNYPVVKQSRSYKNELAPRFALMKLLKDEFSIKASVSRGFSPPTIGELLPSTGVISTALDAEYGWNYEMTLSKRLLHNRLSFEVSGFYFRLNDALVQRRDISGADFFVNAGNIKQRGLELTADYFGGSVKGIIDDYRINAAYTFNHFRYGYFVKGTDDFSGKPVPSVPSNTISLLADINFKKGLYSNITFYSASKIFLNDANTATAEDYQLLGWRLGWRKTFEKVYKLNFYAGVDNLLDEMYSLGNDINAAANRFYNATPGRNYYIGISFQWLKQPKI